MHQVGNSIASGTHGTCSWTIDKDGVLKVFPTDGKYGMLESQDNMGYFTSPWEKFNNSIVKIVVEQGVSTNRSANSLFRNLNQCKEMDLSGLDTSKTKDMYGMFYGCSSLIKLNLSNFDTRTAENMSSLCCGCVSLKEVNAGNLDTSNVWTTQSMFEGCKNLHFLDISNFDMCNVVNKLSMFKGCDKLENRKELEDYISKSQKHKVDFSRLSKEGELLEMFRDIKYKKIDEDLKINSVKKSWKPPENMKKLNNIKIKSHDEPSR